MPVENQEAFAAAAVVVDVVVCSILDPLFFRDGTLGFVSNSVKIKKYFISYFEFIFV